MEPVFCDKPVPHLVIDNFFDDYENVSAVAESLYFMTDLGSHGVYEESPITSRNEFYLYPMMLDPDVKKFVGIMRDRLWCPESRETYEKTPFPFPMINSTSYDGMLIGYYGDKGYYRMHKDSCFITCVILLHKEKRFDGGDFVLSNKAEPDNGRPFESVSIESKPNRAIFFPSCYHHGVSKIKTEDESLNSMRISFACFMGFDNK